MMVGKGKKGYHNVMGKDPYVHSQSARGIKQPQRLSMSQKIAITKNLNLKDTDGDKVADKFDCRPNNPKMQDIKLSENTINNLKKIAFDYVDGFDEYLEEKGFTRIYGSYGQEDVEWVFPSKELAIFREATDKQRKEINKYFLNEINKLKSKGVKLINYGTKERPEILAVNKEYYKLFPEKVEEQIIKSQSVWGVLKGGNLKGDKGWRKRLENN